MGIIASCPAADELEVNVFGPGYGECCLVHVGGGSWIIIDSCIDAETDRPSALVYLEAIGVNPADSLKLIVASHWHDDHIRGMPSILNLCKSARFSSSAALNRVEFVQVLTAYDQNRAIQCGSGTGEIVSTLRILRERNSHPVRASASARLLQLGATETGHGRRVEVWSLSPSNAQFEEFIKEIGTLLPVEKEVKLRVTPTSPNHLSVVIWVAIGSEALLFGADLEEVGKSDFGWSAITASDTRPAGRALFFKIPHHGSRTGHHPDTWAQLVEDEATCVLTPWRLGGAFLPTRDDVTRLLGHTNCGFSTSNLRSTPRTRRPYPVEKQIRETAKLRSIDLKTGHIQVRRRLSASRLENSVGLSPEACSLADLLTRLKGG